ncbi:hypothetical protein [Limosilactobacillus mucosae]|uniref:hypothetical protein n=1 Tax=Limosilactobacillus mucosae TaxID=97478 RepID=UPI000FFB6C05|nr:hypothetical protein [Limosilactobacillus mucosae]RXA55769.1 hypothetical protein EQ839_08430 [Limosilactobacillus mucosae]
MSTRRAKQHKEDTFFAVLDRKNAKMNDNGGLFNKFLNETTHRPRKFRKRAYHRENDLEDEILDKKLQRPSKDALKDLIYRNCINFFRS